MTTASASGARVGLVVGQLTEGGTERQLYELATRLPAAGWPPRVFCLSEADGRYGSLLRARGVPVELLPRRRGFEPRRARLLARALRDHGIEVVHSSLFIANAYARVACCLAGVRAFLPSVRNVEPGRKGVWRAIDRAVLRTSRLVLVNSGDVADWVERTHGLPRARLRIVRNGLDLARFAAVPELPAGRPHAPLVGSVSLFKPQKRIPFLLEIARRVHGLRPGVRFRFTGDGPDMPEILRLREEMGLTGVVDLPGRSEDVASELARFDLFVLASDREGMPNAILEAMAAGRPAVASRVPGTAETVEHGRTGLLFPADDLEAAVQSILRLLDDPVEAAALGRAGREMVPRLYGVERMVEETIAVYRELLGPRVPA